jgi:hypothetical protein
MTKSSSGRLERRGKKMDALQKAYQGGAAFGYNQGVNALAAKLASPEGVLMKDGRTARIVYEAAPAAAEAPATPAPLGTVNNSGDLVQ